MRHAIASIFKLIPVILLVYACLPAGAAKANVYANGIICQPSSPSGMIYTATSIRNGSPNNRTAYCQISPVEQDSPGGQLQIFLKNSGTVARDVTCTVKIGGTYGMGYSTVTQTFNLPANGTGLGTNNYFNDLSRNYYDIIGIACTLPQYVSVEWIGYYEETAA